jgi:hypothetical protein
MIKMRLLQFVGIAATVAIPLGANAQTVIPIGTIAAVADKSPTTWGMSGMEMVKVSRTIGSDTPIMRTLTWDARTVEILSRTQSPPLRSSDIKTFSKNGRQMVVVRRFLLMEVMPADARVANMSTADLADKWAKSIRQVLPRVAPTPNRFGA